MREFGINRIEEGIVTKQKKSRERLYLDEGMHIKVVEYVSRN
jgi:hypothetical protein